MISGQVNDVVFHLNLLEHMHRHQVFRVSLLEPYKSTSTLHLVVPPPPTIELADGPEYEVEAILDSKIMWNKLYYFVDWSGYTPNDRTWKHAENVVNAS